MIKFNFDGEKVTLPTSWEEVTVETFVNPDFLSGNALKLLANLSGIPLEKLANTTEDLTKYFNKVTSFISKDPQGWKGSPETPISLEFMGVNCKIPMDIEMQTFGQKALFGQALAEAERSMDLMAEAVAIYLAPQVDPIKWHDRIEEMAQEASLLPITKVWPVADFFLSIIYELKKNGVKY